MPTTEPSGISRFFTRTRRIPIYVGKLPGGTRLPFGPYRVEQLAVGSIVLVVGFQTMRYWGPLVGSGALIQIVVLVIVSLGLTIVSGKLPSTRRKLPSLALDAATAVTVASTGTYRGRPITLRPPHHVAGKVAIATTVPTITAAYVPPPAVVAEPIQVVEKTPAPQPVTVRGFATGLDRLLEQARREES